MEGREGEGWGGKRVRGEGEICKVEDKGRRNNGEVGRGVRGGEEQVRGEGERGGEVTLTLS